MRENSSFFFIITISKGQQSTRQYQTEIPCYAPREQVAWLSRPSQEANPKVRHANLIRVMFTHLWYGAWIYSNDVIKQNELLVRVLLAHSKAAYCFLDPKKSFIGESDAHRLKDERNK